MAQLGGLAFGALLVWAIARWDGFGAPIATLSKWLTALGSIGLVYLAIFIGRFLWAPFNAYFSQYQGGLPGRLRLRLGVYMGPLAIMAVGLFVFMGGAIWYAVNASKNANVLRVSVIDLQVPHLAQRLATISEQVVIFDSAAPAAGPDLADRLKRWQWEFAWSFEQIKNSHLKDFGQRVILPPAADIAAPTEGEDDIAETDKALYRQAVNAFALNRPIALGIKLRYENRIRELQRERAILVNRLIAM